MLGVARNQGVGFIGQRVYSVTKRNIQERYSMTLMTSIVDVPCFIQFRKDSNTQYDFIEFIMQAIEGKFLQRDDIVIFDNALVHCGKNIKEMIDNLAETIGFTIQTLPTYSPELNPCELVFNYLKTIMRYHYDESFSLKSNVILTLAKISNDMMLKFYKHCTSQCNALNMDLIRYAQINE